jgi:hypothetical protein
MPPIKDGEDKVIHGGQMWEDVEPQVSPVPGPDGGPVVSGYLGEAPPVPKAGAHTLLCLSGPCKYYFEWHTRADVDTRGLEQEPRQLNRVCTAIPGVHNDLTDDCVYVCNRWDPLTRAEVRALEGRRNQYRRLVQKLVQIQRQKERPNGR